MSLRINVGWMALIPALMAPGCGGNSSAGSTSTTSSSAPTDTSEAAARATATNNSLCATDQLGSYYWEIGDANGAMLQVSVGETSTTLMSIASASKWIYGAYVVERRGGASALDISSDIPYLHFTSGYSQLSSTQGCNDDAVRTVDECLNVTDTSGTQNEETVGKFAYDAGHMQKHASLLGLGSMSSSALGKEVSEMLGLSFKYSQPMLAGGVYTTPATYIAFLQRILGGQLSMRDALGADAVCTNPLDTEHGCNSSNAEVGPIPTSESWHYAIGHWVEDDPYVGDGAYSSAGALGFYPWIDQSKTWYGVLARQQEGEKQGYASAQCGRLIRHAWMTGVEQTGNVPQ